MVQNHMAITREAMMPVKKRALSTLFMVALSPFWAA
jgi:hypothetical protein